MVGPVAYKLLCNLITPKKPAELSYEELVAAMSKHHNPTPSEIVQRYKFNTRTRHPGESIATFTAELSLLAKFCNFGDSLDDMLRDRLVCGIADTQIQRRLLAESKLTLKKATELALGMEAAVKNAQTLQSTPSRAIAQDESLHKVQGGHRKKVQKASQPVCYQCGVTGHVAQVCKHKSSKCHSCGKVGHLQKVCRSKPKKDIVQQGIHAVESHLTEEYQLYPIHTSQDSKSLHNPYVVEINLDEHPVRMKIDTGASVSIISSATYQEKFCNKPLQASTVKLKTYADKPLQNLGSLSVHVKHNSQELQLPVLVVEGDGPNFFGSKLVGEASN